MCVYTSTILIYIPKHATILGPGGKYLYTCGLKHTFYCSQIYSNVLPLVSIFFHLLYVDSLLRLTICGICVNKCVYHIRRIVMYSYLSQVFFSRQFRLVACLVFIYSTFRGHITCTILWKLWYIHGCICICMDDRNAVT